MAHLPHKLVILLSFLMLYTAATACGKQGRDDNQINQAQQQPPQKQPQQEQSNQ